jgi:tetratricopeptide (TPR) repeat protein
VANPLSFETRDALATALSARGSHDEAIEVAEPQLYLHEDYPQAHARVGGLYAVIGKTPEAIEKIERAFELGPWRSDLLGVLAALELRAGNRRRSDEFLEQLAQRPHNPFRMIGYAVYFAFVSQFDRAAEQFDAMVDTRRARVDDLFDESCLQ